MRTGRHGSAFNLPRRQRRSSPAHFNSRACSGACLYNLYHQQAGRALPQLHHQSLSQALCHWLHAVGFVPLFASGATTRPFISPGICPWVPCDRNIRASPLSKECLCNWPSPPRSKMIHKIIPKAPHPESHCTLRVKNQHVQRRSACVDLLSGHVEPRTLHRAEISTWYLVFRTKHLLNQLPLETPWKSMPGVQSITSSVPPQKDKTWLGFMLQLQNQTAAHAIVKREPPSKCVGSSGKNQKTQKQIAQTGRGRLSAVLGGHPPVTRGDAPPCTYAILSVILATTGEPYHRLRGAKD